MPVVLSILALCIISGLSVIIMVLYSTDDVLLYTFQVQRHGARAPMIESASEEFPVPVDMLTPQGMRQLYLLGRYQQAQMESTFNDDNFRPLLNFRFFRNEQEVVSTEYYRTLQSLNSYNIGVIHNMIMKYPDHRLRLRLSEAQVAHINLNTSTTIPPFKTRRGATISSTLQDQAIVNGYNYIPVHTNFQRKSFNNKVSFWGCPYTMKTDVQLFTNYSSYNNYD